MRTFIAIAGLILTLIPNSAAQSIDWEDVKTPVRAEQFSRLAETGQTGYAIGAMQTSAHLNGRSPEQRACISDLSDLFRDVALNTPAGTPVISEAANLTVDECPSGSTGTGSPPTVAEMADLNVRDQSPSLWIGFIVGASDYLHYQAFAALGEEKADCLGGSVLSWLGRDISDPYTWTDDPDILFVELMVDAALVECE